MIMQAQADQPVRLLHTADCHLGSDVQDGRREMEAFTSLIQAATVIRPAALVIAGDLFDHHKVSDEVIAWTLDQMGRLDCHVIVLPGNHDSAVLARLAAGSNGCNHAGQAQITIITAPDGQMVRVPHVGLNLWGRALTDHTPAFRPLCGVPARPADGWSVALGHGLVVDDRNSGRRASPIYPADIEAIEWDYVALGHVHAYRVVRDLPATPVVYSGATASSYGGKPGAVLVEFHSITGVSFRWQSLLCLSPSPEG